VVGHFIGKSVREDLQQLRAHGEFRTDRAFALVSFAVVPRASEEYLSLDLVEGTLSDPGKHQKLARTLPIPLGYVVANPMFADIKLYDNEPPPPLLMDLVHDTVNKDITWEERRVLQEKNEVRKAISVGELRQQLSAAFGPGEQGDGVPEIPQKGWVKRAMDLFVKLGWAERDKQRRDQYIYVFKRRRNPLRQFHALWAAELHRKEKRQKRLKKKMPLFKDALPDDD